MKRFGVIIAIATLLIVGGGIYLFSRNSASEQAAPLSAPTSYEYYWGNGCPHCKNVEDFLSSWQGKDKIKLEKFEVFDNRENASVMQKRAKACGINPSGMGVPFMVTPEGKCLDGDVPIIQFFKDLKF